jgi:uncharacterized RDD family membrane protein YckC
MYDAPTETAERFWRRAVSRASAWEFIVSHNRPADLPARFCAQLIDATIAFIPLLFFTIFSVLLEFEMVLTGSIALLGLAFVATYMLFSDGMSRGQSWGKRMLKIAVVDERTGAPCTFGQSLVRNLSLGLLSIVDVLFIFGTARRRLGDILAKTVVVRV